MAMLGDLSARSTPGFPKSSLGFCCSRVKVIKMWKVIGKKGQVERLACWDFILADDELASIMGKGDKSIGKSMLESMKSVRALDVNRDDMIVETEFQRLYLSSALTAAMAAVTSN